MVVGRTVNLGMGFVFQATGRITFLKNVTEIEITKIKHSIPI